LAASHNVLGIGQQSIVGTDLVSTQLKEWVIRRQRVQIQQDRFGCAGSVRPAHDHRILGARREPALVPVAAIPDRHTGIILLQTGHDLAVNGIDSVPNRRKNGIRVGSFVPQVAEHLGIGASVVAQPEPRVFAHPLRRCNEMGSRWG
jgi:hypothetical protein